MTGPESDPPSINDLDLLMARAMEESTWSVPGVDDEPTLEMARWCILRVPPDGALHLMGYCSIEGRMSTAIIAYDPRTQRARTASGREYELVSRPGWDRDAEHVANEWLYRRGITQRAHELRLSNDELAMFTSPANASISWRKLRDMDAAVDKLERGIVSEPVDGTTLGELPKAPEQSA